MRYRTRSLRIVPAIILLAACTTAPSPAPPDVVGSPAAPGPAAACLDGAPPPEAAVYAFFTCEGAPLPSEPRPVPRQAQAADSESQLESALTALLAGPTRAETQAGYWSWFSEDTALALNSVSIEPQGLAIVDLGDLRPVIPNASTSAGSGVLISQLNATVFQVEEVTAVEYRIDGSCQTFFEWLQGICGVIQRP